MIKDRAILELSAKAIGLKVFESVDGTVQCHPILVYLAGGGMGTMSYEEKWSPTTFTSQATDLMVSLKIDVMFETKSSPHTHDRVTAWIDNHTRFDEFIDEKDRMKAFCRAITKAAAEIQRRKENNNE